MNPRIIILPAHHTANIIAIRPTAVAPFKVACYEGREGDFLQVYDDEDNPVTGVGYHIPSDEMLDVVAHNRRVNMRIAVIVIFTAAALAALINYVTNFSQH